MLGLCVITGQLNVLSVFIFIKSISLSNLLIYFLCFLTTDYKQAAGKQMELEKMVTCEDRTVNREPVPDIHSP